MLAVLRCGASAVADDEVIRAVRAPRPRGSTAVSTTRRGRRHQLDPDPPRRGCAPPGQAIQLRILFDDEAVFFGVRLFDDHADRIASRLTRRDREIEAAYFPVWIDSRNDQASA